MDVVPRFSDVVEAVEKLSLEEQETLFELVHRRLIERRREALATAVADAHEEYERGECRAVTVADLMAEILE
jgi:hypothetical protein